MKALGPDGQKLIKGMPAKEYHALWKKKKQAGLTGTHDKIPKGDNTYVRLPLATREALEALADARGVSYSALCRGFILAGLAEATKPLLNTEPAPASSLGEWCED